jgi:hypothetical protein
MFRGSIAKLAFEPALTVEKIHEIHQDHDDRLLTDTMAITKNKIPRTNSIIYSGRGRRQTWWDHYSMHALRGYGLNYTIE